MNKKKPAAIGLLALVLLQRWLHYTWILPKQITIFGGLC